MIELCVTMRLWKYVQSLCKSYMWHCVICGIVIALRQDDAACAGRAYDNQWRCVTKANFEPAECRECQSHVNVTKCDQVLRPALKAAATVCEELCVCVSVRVFV